MCGFGTVRRTTDGDGREDGNGGSRPEGRHEGLLLSLSVSGAALGLRDASSALHEAAPRTP